jgi:hypothetical protein
MSKAEKETSKAVELKEKQRQLRERQTENEEFIKEIEKLNSTCFALSDNLKFEREKNESLKKEMNFRKKHLDNIEKNYTSFLEKNNPSSKIFVMELKKKMIREKLIELVIDRIPELNTNTGAINNDANAEEGNENEFRNLIIDHVALTYIKYEGNKRTGLEDTDKQSFRIAKNSKFISLKKIACQFWDINEESEYVITDEAEGLIYNEDMCVDNWLKENSVLANNFKLVPLNAIKSRNNLVGNQVSRIKENNKIGSRAARKENFAQSNIVDSSKVKIREFFREYPGLKPFILVDQEEVKKGGADKNLDDKDQAVKIETSFLMLVLLVVFSLLNIFFIYNNRDIDGNNLKINYAKNLFDNSKVSNYITLYQWLIFRLCSNFSSTGFYNINSVWADDARTPYITNLKNVLDTQGVDYSQWLKTKKIYIPENKKTITIMDPEPFYKFIEKKRQNAVNFKFVSSVRMIMNRVKESACTTNKMVKDTILLKIEKCMETFHDSKTEQKDFSYQKIDPRMIPDKFFTTSFKNFTKFKTAEEAQITLNVSRGNNFVFLNFINFNNFFTKLSKK